MARMIPDMFDGPSSAERKVFEALRDQLDDGYTVFHSVEWLSRRKDRSLMGEADFVVVSPRRGVLAIECKGGRIAHDACSPDWISIDRHGVWHAIKDPIRQARDSAMAMRDALRHAGILGADRKCRAYAVCFPDVPRGRVPRMPALPSSLLIRMEDLPCIEPALLRAWSHHDQRGGSGFASEKEMQAAVDAIAPGFAVAWSLAQQVERERQELVRLTEEQLRVLGMASAMRRALILGCAGSGKTLVAIEKARRLAREGKRVLFVCFNLFLADDVRRRLAEGPEGIETYSFEMLAREMARRAGLAWNRPSAPDEAVQRFYDEEMPDLLERAAAALGASYDAIVVDEGQDFLTRYYEALRPLLRGGEGVFYVFADPGQDVFGRSVAYPQDLQGPLRLSYNCRNTAAISRLLQRLTDERVPVRRDAPAGEEPRAFPCSSRREQKEAVSRLVEELSGRGGLPPERIAILSCRRAERSAVGDETVIGGVALARNKFPCPRGSIFVTSLLRFKGLEADAVIVTDIDASLPRFSRTHLYVAASRARHRLFLVGTPDGLALLRDRVALDGDRSEAF